ncbi:hypothetical protein RHMOL_Rhmol12G0068100 [Rhododendron molle]|uniref:Uncharacterized protein n=1 Tax=Rhododendron molle TaxID=49168 RepID=A0ACC0LF32_RHOML|nr:hypothetical protein RHMOL_Rhmol12G0068100 [Rhododendron molle]
MLREQHFFPDCKSLIHGSFCVRGFSHGRGVQSRDFSCGAKSELKRSAVADNESGKIKLSDVRTSSGMFIAKGKELVFHCSGPNGYWQDTHPPAGLKTWALPREGDHFEHNSILLLLHYWGLHVNGFIYIAALGPDEIWMLVLT